MPNYLAPDVYIEEVSSGIRPIQAVGTSTAAFVGVSPDASKHLNEAVAVNNWTQFLAEYVSQGSKSTPLSQAVFGYFQNGGARCYVVNVGEGKPISGAGTGLNILERIDEVAIVAAPGFTDPASYDALLTHCETLKDRVGVLDGPELVTDLNLLTQVATVPSRPTRRGEAAGGDTPAPTGARPRPSDFGAFYYPWLTIRDPLSPNDLVNVPPSGHMAGIWARTDATRGVHKAPANEIVRGALNVTHRLTRDEQGLLNQNGVNAIRLFSREGIRVWGARTVATADSEWRYISVRRLFNMIEESIAEGTRWIVFEPNDYTLWKSIRRDITAFLTRIWRDGALMGRTPEQAFFVKCDEETNPPDVIEAGIVVTVIGIAPVKPAEFIVFRISQYAGSTQVETL